MPAESLLAGRFELDRVAGTGGMGTVYRARDTWSGELVAVKVLRGAGLLYPRRFEREARILADLRHPAVVRYITHGITADKSPFLVMEWLEGADLAAVISESPLSVPRALTLVRRVAEALHATHAVGVVHRDVKPRNLFLQNREEAKLKLIDFGVARTRELGGTPTHTGRLVGTAGYAAPEQIQGKKRIDGRADVFALGCVLFRCLVGRLPFQGGDAITLLARSLFEEAPSISSLVSGVPVALDELVRRMLAKDPNARPSAAGVAAELAPLEGLVEVRVAAPATQAGTRAMLTHRERRLASVVAAWDGAGGASPDDSTVTMSGSVRGGPVDLGAVRARLGKLGGRVQTIAGGPWVVTVKGAPAAEQVVCAARCALCLRDMLPGWKVGIATGPAEPRRYGVSGEVVERALSLLGLETASADSSRAVRLDETSAGLLAFRFDVRVDSGAFWLNGDGAPVTSARLLLGKESPFVGRARELRLLQETYRDCVAQAEARAFLITAPPGAGKSRLIVELQGWLERQERAAAVWIARGDPGGRRSAFGLLVQLLEAAIGAGPRDRAVQRAQKLRALVAQRFEGAELLRIAEFLGEILEAPGPGPASAELRAARSDAALMGAQMRAAWERLVAVEAERGPVVIVLEDLQWSDPPTVAFVDAALRAAADRRLMVVASARPEAEEVFPRLWAERPLTRITLPPISPASAARLARAALGSDVDPHTIERIVAIAQGSAFFLEELIRQVHEGRRDEYPVTVLATVQARMEALEGDARRVLRAASVFGAAFSAEAVQSLTAEAGDADATEAWLAALTDRELLVSSGWATPRPTYSFRHAIVREAAYQALTPADRELGHLLAGQWLEAAGTNDATVLADHYERGGSAARAARFYLRAAEQAVRANDFRGALDRADRALGAGLPRDDQASALLVQAEAHRWLAEYEQAEARALSAMGLLGANDARWWGAAGQVAIATGRDGDLAGLLRLAEVLHAKQQEGRGEPARVVALSRVAHRLFLSASPEPASRVLSQAETELGKDGIDEPMAMANVWATRAVKGLLSGDLGTYLEAARCSVESFETAGALRDACVQSINVGSALNELGDYAEAEDILRVAKGRAAESGLEAIVTLAEHNLCLSLAHLGHLAEAKQVAERVLEWTARHPDARIESGTRIYLTTILLLSGDVEGACQESLRAVAVAPSGHMQPYAQALYASSLIRLGRVQEARQSAADAVRLLEELGGSEGGEGTVYLTYGEALAAAGETAGARGAIRTARDRLLARADRIAARPWRESLLQRVPDHARTLHLFEAWCENGDPQAGPPDDP